MERGICIVENKNHLEEYRNYFFDPQLVYNFFYSRKNNYDIRLHKIYDENGNFLHYDKLVVEKIGGVKIVAKMVETKFQFRGKFKIVRYDVAVFGEKIYFTTIYNYLNFCGCRSDFPRNVILIFSHGLVCAILVRMWDEKFHDEIIIRKNLMLGDKKDPNLCPDMYNYKGLEPIPCLAEQIKINLLEMIKK